MNFLVLVIALFAVVTAQDGNMYYAYVPGTIATCVISKEFSDGRYFYFNCKIASTKVMTYLKMNTEKLFTESGYSSKYISKLGILVTPNDVARMSVS
jgi:hypothetical protein